jgi:hypothetical protein
MNARARDGGTRERRQRNDRASMDAWMHGCMDASIDRSIETVREVRNGTARMG